jgi:2,5-diketo-D-gluconate reductase A
MTSMNNTEFASLRLNDGGELPAVGFGAWQLQDPERAVLDAVEVGYRLIDTASIYGNERQVGAAIRSCGLAREAIQVTTKLFNTEHGREKALDAFDRSLDQLGLDYVDYYLIHWPLPGVDRYVETWDALIAIHASARARHIGVSNFMPEHLRRLIDETGVVPVLNQVESHPYLPQENVRVADEALSIVTQAWSPLANGAIVHDPVIVSIAAEHGVSPARVALRWQLQRGLGVIPKASSSARMADNLDLASFTLSDADLARIGTLRSDVRTGNDPRVYNGVGLPLSAVPFDRR